MKKLIALLLCAALVLILAGCAQQPEPAQIAATTLPVYEFTARLCENTDITVTRLVTEEVSCLHDYSLQTKQMRAIEGADVIVISGGGLEEFLEDALHSAHNVIDASAHMVLHCAEHTHEGHSHENDPHFWLSPENAKSMVHNIAHGLKDLYPLYADTIEANEEALLLELDALQAYGQKQLAELTCRKLITFHDGFAYFAESFDLEIIRAVEEESGSEASAQELIELITLVQAHNLPGIFTERSGSTCAAQIIAAETGAKLYTLDMAMAGDSYFEAMYHNIDTVKEALG